MACYSDRSAAPTGRPRHQCPSGASPRIPLPEAIRSAKLECRSLVELLVIVLADRSARAGCPHARLALREVDADVLSGSPYIKSVHQMNWWPKISNLVRTGPMSSSRWPASRLHMGPVSVFVAVSARRRLRSGQRRSQWRLKSRYGRKQRDEKLAPVISSSWRSSSWRPFSSLQPSLPFSPSLPCRPLDLVT